MDPLRTAATRSCPGADSDELITECRDERGIHPICGFQNPEDLALLADGRTLVVSQFGSMTSDRPGNAGALRRRDRAAAASSFPALPDVASGPPIASAEPGIGAIATAPARPGDRVQPRTASTCASDPDGRLQLLVVNHGGRESDRILRAHGGEAAGTAVAWRGCAIAAGESPISTTSWRYRTAVSSRRT